MALDKQMIRLHNTLTGKKDEFKSIKDGEIGIYSCGPTVYWNQHIGHMYAYVHWDTLVRSLKYLGYKTKWVMNITDVGHLTGDNEGDADTGEDKMEKGAKREGLTVWEIADKYIEQFKESMVMLNINLPDVLCRATEHIPEQIALIKKIEENGFAYPTKTGLVFETDKFSDYSKFARLDLENQLAGSRVEVDEEKKQPWDFLLWVTNQPNHIMKWESPWGVGFPGWHIECTAMSTKYLGETFDIHTGGKEHVPVHHTNEVAQAYGAFGHQTANYWLHNEWMLFEGKKISKSLGNSILVTDLKEKGFHPLSLRYLIMTSHYKTGLNFTWESIEGAQTALEKVVNNYTNLPERVEDDHLHMSNGTFDTFDSAIADDLNTPIAISLLHEAKSKQEIEVMDKVLGLNIKKLAEQIKEIPSEIIDLQKQREEVRKSEDWKLSDELRDRIEAKGFVVKDTSEGAIVLNTLSNLAKSL